MCPLAGWASSAVICRVHRVPDAVQAVALLRRAGEPKFQCAAMGPGSAAHRRSRAKRDPERAAQHPGHGCAYAMNMRAAEAMVSSAPKPMKIFPIREVWSQVELSLLLAAKTGATGTSAEAIARVAGLPSRSARSTSLS